jgi:glycosyltransferase involved in cell wall biosynthesis
VIGRRRPANGAGRELETLAGRPLISVVVPTYDTDPRHLREAIASVRRQTYPDWELVLVDDGSGRAETRRAITRAVSRDPRITARMLDRNAGISAATNAGLELCRGELVAFLDHDDVLAPNALLRVAQAFDAGDVDVVYTDQDKLRTSSCSCASPSAPSGSITSPRSSTTGARSPGASRWARARRRASRSCRRGP